MDLVANTQKFTEGLQRATKSMNTWAKRNKKTLNQIKKGFQVLTVAAGAAAAGIVALTKKGLESVDALAKMSRAVGLLPQQLRALQYASTLSGGSIESMNRLLTTMNKNIGDAANGTGEAKAVFERFGISIEDFQKLSADQQLAILTDKLSGLGSSAEQAAAANKIFGEGWRENASLLLGGSKELNKMVEEFNRLGFSFNAIDTTNVENANNAIARLQTLLSFISQELAIRLAPYIESFTNNITDAAVEAGGFGKIIEKVANGVISSIRFILDAWHTFMVGLKAGQLLFIKLYEVITYKVLDIVSAINFASEGIQSLINGISSGIESAFSNVSSAVENGINLVINSAEFLVNGVISIVESVINASISGLSKLLDPVIDMINGLIEKYNYFRGTNISQLQKLSGTTVELGRVSFGEIDLKDSIDIPEITIPKIDTQPFQDAAGAATDAVKLMIKEIDDYVMKGSASRFLDLNLSEKTDNKTPVESNQELNDGLEKTKTLVGEVGTSIQKNITDSLTSAAESGKFAFEDFGRTVLAEIIKIVSSAAFNKLSNVGSGGTGGGSGGFWSGIAQGVTSYFAGGGMANGGNVNAGTRYMIGERGPEMFVPNVNGTIIPNDQIGGNTFNIDARGADVAAVQRLERMVYQLNGDLESRAMFAVRTENQRNPSFLRR